MLKKIKRERKNYSKSFIKNKKQQPKICSDFHMEERKSENNRYTEI